MGWIRKRGLEAGQIKDWGGNKRQRRKSETGKLLNWLALGKRFEVWKEMSGK